MSKRVPHFVLSCLCVAVIFVGVTATPLLQASAVSYFTPSPTYPSVDDLPCGQNTIVVEVRYNSTTWYRFYLPYNVFFYLEKPSSGNNAKLVIVFPQLLSGVTTGTNRGYYQTRDSSYNWSSTSGFTANTALENNYAFYFFNLTSYITQDTYQFYSNVPAYNYDTVSWNSSIRVYPSNASNIVSRVNDNVDREVSSLNAQESRRAATEATQLSRQHSDDMTQRSQQHSEIMNAGQDITSLDTNNNWMNDSLTKVNGWLDNISNFEQQMISNRAENQSNMAQAGSFLRSFFDNIPGGLIAALSLVLVMIVVVKIVGR